MEYFELIKVFVLSPVETSQKVRDTNYGDTLVYFLVLGILTPFFPSPLCWLPSHRYGQCLTACFSGSILEY
jgi:hypothetical protein